MNENCIIYPLHPVGQGQLARSILSGNQPVVLFGSGIFARDILQAYRAMGIKIRCIVDNNAALHGTFWDGIEITAVEKCCELGLPVIIGTERFYDQAYAQLSLLGVSEMLPFYFFAYERGGFTYKDLIESPYLTAEAIERLEINRIREEKPDALVIKNIEIVITERCSLRCSDCANLMQFYQHPQDEPLAIQLQAVERLLKACDFIGQIVLIGGEPLINRELAKYMEYLREKPGFGMLHIYSNGTILPSPEVCEQLRSGRAFMSVSNYGALSCRLEELKRQAKRESLPVNFLQLSDRWYPFGEIKRYAAPAQELIAKYNACTVKMCHSLKGGKLSTCPFAAHAATLGAIPPKALKSIDCADPTLPIEKLRAELVALQAQQYDAACAFCPGLGPDKGFVEAARQSATPRSYTHYS